MTLMKRNEKKIKKKKETSQDESGRLCAREQTLMDESELLLLRSQLKIRRMNNGSDQSASVVAAAKRI